MRRLALTLCCLSLLAVPATASAADFNPAAGTYTVDTTTLKLTGPGTNITGVNQGGVAVFSFGTVNIVGGVTINASGNRPFKLVAAGDLTMNGTINASGTSATANFTPGPYAGGPGGGAGGATSSTKGIGPGGGGIQPTSNDGAGGGGFGGRGARGGKNGVAGATTGVAPGGVSYGNLNGGPLQGGSGGGGGSNVGGGGGGGAVALFGNNVTIGGVVFADGGGGAVGGCCGASGGGSGGAIVIHGDSVDVNGGAAVARGGAGGAGGCCGDGGGGGGGRIAYQFRTLGSSGFTLVDGGTSGIRDVGGGCAGPGGSCGHGGTSADATGAAGVFTKKQAATATTSPATGVSSNAATLNGTVNPNGSGTSFFFQYGQTTAYGSQTSARSAGAGSTGVAVAAGVSGLAPSTTYHFRVVAVDSLGFVTPGVDVGFTTAAAPPPPPPPPPPTLLGSTITNRWIPFPKFTKVFTLAVNDIPASGRVKVQCKTKKKSKQKKACPFKSKTFKNANAKRKLKLTKRFKKKKLPPGTKITITITATGFIGKRFTYTTRKGKAPKPPKRVCILTTGKPGKCP